MAQTAKFERINASRVYQQGKGAEWLMGEETWTALGEEILSSEAKALVTADPDLSTDTIRRLIMLQGGVIYDVPFAFGDEDSPDGDIGLALLSSCIKDNKDATWAEIVARYAAIRRCPFLETAIALKNLQKERGLFYYAAGTKIATAWWPRQTRMQAGDIGKISDLDSEWELLATPHPAVGF